MTHDEHDYETPIAEQFAPIVAEAEAAAERMRARLADPTDPTPPAELVRMGRRMICEALSLAEKAYEVVEKAREFDRLIDEHRPEDLDDDPATDWAFTLGWDEMHASLHAVQTLITGYTGSASWPADCVPSLDELRSKATAFLEDHQPVDCPAKPIPAWLDQAFVPYELGAKGGDIARRFAPVFSEVVALITESRDFIAEVDALLAEHDVDGDEVIDAVYHLTDVRELYTKLYLLDEHVGSVVR